MLLFFYVFINWPARNDTDIVVKKEKHGKMSHFVHGESSKTGNIKIVIISFPVAQMQRKKLDYPRETENFMRYKKSQLCRCRVCAITHCFYDAHTRFLYFFEKIYTYFIMIQGREIQTVKTVVSLPKPDNPNKSP